MTTIAVRIKIMNLVLYKLHAPKTKTTSMSIKINAIILTQR